MYSPSSLSSSSLLKAHIRQNVSLVFISEYSQNWNIASLKRYSYIFASVLSFFSFHADSGYAASVQQNFVVTAYYSPLPNQSFYLKGNYEAEKILNGEWTHGASGKPVFVGMIAAPKTYSFGTRIDFDGLGVGIVEDRGGAIVKAWERGYTSDRIDIWMGSWESGLRRAMVWGKRNVTGTITTDTTAPLLNFRDIDTGKINLWNYKKATTTISSAYLDADTLARFSDLWYTVEGSDVRSMVIEFQKDHSIIKSSTDESAWVYGPKTKSTLTSEYAKYIQLRDAEIAKIESEKALLISARNEWESSYTIANMRVSAIGSPKRGESGAHISSLQKTLKSKGYFKGKESGVMSGSTILAVKSLQKSYGIKQTGTIDTATKDILLTVLAESV
jgi:3D (Asp-Asp-Asp) domain-containing protein